MFDFKSIDTLLDRPDSWDSLSDEALEEALAVAVVGFALQRGQAFSEVSLTPFVDYGINRLSVQSRLRLVVRLGETFERWGRREGTPAGVAALLPIIFRENNPGVIATATIVSAESIAPEGGDDLTGPKRALDVGRRFDDERRGVVLGALVQMGDPRVCGLVSQEWKLCSAEACRSLLEIVGQGPATVAGFEFILGVIQDDPTDEHYGSASGALVRLIRTAKGRGAHSTAGQGIVDVERTLPCWKAPEGMSPIRVKRRGSVSEFAPAIRPRLEALEAREREPRVLSHVLAELDTSSDEL